MKSRILARVAPEGSGYKAKAYQRDKEFCSVAGISDADALDRLTTIVEAALAPQAKEWIKQWTGSQERPNCPEAAIKLPIDLWVCKLFGELCPIQGQVLLDEPRKFLRCCLAEPKRREQILDVVSSKKYSGFHHVPGRYLCVRCEQEGRKISFRHHYPWELTNIEACSSFVMVRDWPGVMLRLRKKGMHMANVTTPLCAAHCIELVKELEPGIADQYRILKFEVSSSGVVATEGGGT
ncbi:hypothetical protein ACFLZG_03985 [Thermodesulfobacteriota bacterium]